jgi:hypothetical protein
MPYVNRQAQKEAQQRWYARNKERIDNRRKEKREEINRRNRERIEEKRERIRRLKEESSCSDCDQQYPYYVMDYDHCRGSKIAGLARLVGAGVSWEFLAAEIAKCDLVCANCHREREHQRHQAARKI